MARRKTHEVFVAEVNALVGDAYTVIGMYQTSKINIEIKHNSCGKKFTIRPGNFLSGGRCRTCVIKRNSDKQRKSHSKFISEIREVHSGSIRVLSEYNGSEEKVRCEHVICGHIWIAKASNLLNGSGCPQCSRKTKDTTDFREEVKSLTSGKYIVLSEYETSTTKISMKHTECGNVFETKPCNFLRGCRCPYCIKGQRQTTLTFAYKVAKETDGEYLVLSNYENGKTKIKVKHITCGTIYKVAPDNFLCGNRCPKCKESRGERKIREWLITKGISFVAQQPIKYNMRKRPLKIDFLVQEVAIEYDGEYHYKPMSHAGGKGGLRDQQRRDRIKDKYCADNGIPIIRIPYWDFDNIDEILTQKLLPLLHTSCNAKLTQKIAI